jgi:CubicO group peptidase (beta-lactamase class C family)
MRIYFHPKGPNKGKMEVMIRVIVLTTLTLLNASFLEAQTPGPAAAPTASGTPTPMTAISTPPPTPLPTASATFTVTSTPTTNPHPDYSEAVSNLNAYLLDKVGKDNVKGFSVALVDGGKIVWVKGFGQANPTTHEAVTGDTLYRLGATSELFTAAESMKLVQARMVGLEDPLSIPGFSIHNRFKNAKPITLRSLLAQHSGLPGFFYRGMWGDPSPSLTDLVKSLQADYMVAPPQTLYKYSYIDYDLLGRVIEVESKQSFPDALRQDWFEPLGMDSSSFGETVDSTQTLAPGCRGGNIFEVPRYRDVPAVGMISSANDMAKFLLFILGGKTSTGPAPLNRKTVTEMFKPQFPGLPLDFGQSFGLGWRLSGLSVEGAKTTAWRGGEYPGYTSQVAVLPHEKLGVVFLSNSNEADKLAGETVDRALKLMLHAKTGAPVNLDKPKIAMPPLVPVPTEELEKNTGDYSALGQLVRISRQDNHLSAEFTGYRVDLLPVAEDTFVPHLVFLFLFPIDLPQYPLSFATLGLEQVAILGGLPFVLPLQKIAAAPIPEAWKAREGDYMEENPEPLLQFQTLHLTERNGFLTVEMKVSLPAFDLKEKDYRVALLPLSDNEATVPGLFYGDGGTLRAEDHPGHTRVFYSGYWFSKIQTK